MADSQNLSDLSNEGFDFNDYIKSKNNDKNLIDESIKLKAQNRMLSYDLSKAKTDKERTDIQAKIDRNNKKIEENGFAGSLNLGDNRSLYDKYALLDYGRYIRSDAWTEYLTSDKNVYDVESHKNSFVTNTNFPKNAPVNDQEPNSELSLIELVEWSERYPALQLRMQDFVYCKRMDFFPNNRLIILRRFKNGVPDNLFDHHPDNESKIDEIQPLSTLVTWMKPDDVPISLSFKEEWATESKGLEEILSDVFSLNNNGVGDKIIGFISNVTHLLTKSRKDGINPKYIQQGGDPNLIYSSAKRKIPGLGENSKGLSSNITFDLMFEFEMRLINNVDPHIAMLDLLSNCFRMGTSVGHFRFPISSLEKSEILKSLISSNIDEATKSFMDVIRSGNADIKNALNDFLKSGTTTSTASTTASTNNVSNLVSNAATYAISRYKERLKSALAADTGTPSGIWHVTIGNPKKPIISCGDLIISDSSIELGTEMGLGDFPTSFKYKIKLISARERGRDELERIFNAGRGRIYVYQHPKHNPDNFTPNN